MPVIVNSNQINIPEKLEKAEIQPNIPQLRPQVARLASTEIDTQLELAKTFRL